MTRQEKDLQITNEIITEGETKNQEQTEFLRTNSAPERLTGNTEDNLSNDSTIEYSDTDDMVAMQNDNNVSTQNSSENTIVESVENISNHSDEESHMDTSPEIVPSENIDTKVFTESVNVDTQEVFIENINTEVVTDDIVQTNGDLADVDHSLVNNVIEDNEEEVEEEEIDHCKELNGKNIIESG